MIRKSISKLIFELTILKILSFPTTEHLYVFSYIIPINIVSEHLTEKKMTSVTFFPSLPSRSRLKFWGQIYTSG